MIRCGIVVDEPAGSIDATPAQVALGRVMDHPSVTAPNVDVRSTEQLEESLGALDVSLSDEQFERIDDGRSS